MQLTFTICRPETLEISLFQILYDGTSLSFSLSLFVLQHSCAQTTVATSPPHATTVRKPKMQPLYPPPEHHHHHHRHHIAMGIINITSCAMHKLFRQDLICLLPLDPLPPPPGPDSPTNLQWDLDIRRTDGGVAQLVMR